MKLDFKDRHIVITGGTGALGTAVTQLFLEAGAFCSIPCFNKSELENYEPEGHEKLYIQAGIDLTNEQQTIDFYADTINSSGTLWGSVHIAGGFGMGNIENLTKADFMKQVNMNLVTCFNCCNAAVGHMRSGGGRIVNVSSRPALEPRQGAGRIPYIVSKAGVAALTESLAAEVIQDDILVNAIVPSTIDTPANRKSMPDANFEMWPKPKQLAKQIAWLIAPDNEVTRGGLVPVYGKS